MRHSPVTPTSQGARMYDPRYQQQTPLPFAYVPQPPPPRSRAPFAILGCVGAMSIGIVFLLVIVGLASQGTNAPKRVAQSGNSTGPSKAKAAASKKAVAEVAKIGDTVKDGDLSFTVTKFKPGPRYIGNQYLGQAAQGRFYYVYVTVKNHSDDPAYFTSGGQNLLVGNKQYAADATAASYLKDSKSLFTPINPGNEVDGIIVFDVPKSVKPTAIELHDSTFSRGVKVAL